MDSRIAHLDDSIGGSMAANTAGEAPGGGLSLAWVQTSCPFWSQTVTSITFGQGAVVAAESSVPAAWEGQLNSGRCSQPADSIALVRSNLPPVPGGLQPEAAGMEPPPASIIQQDFRTLTVQNGPASRFWSKFRDFSRDDLLWPRLRRRGMKPVGARAESRAQKPSGGTGSRRRALA